MDKIIDGVLTAAYLVIFTVGSGYTIEKAYTWNYSSSEARWAESYSLVFAI